MKISILMAVYNAEKWLSKAINSVLAQSYNDWELICMDDGSTDSSWNILQQYSWQDKRICIFRYDHCGSHAILLNRGTRLATGEFVFPLDSDDYISSDLLSCMVKRQMETGVDFIIPDMYRVDENGEVMSCMKGRAGNREMILSGRQAVIYSLDWSIHTLGLLRKEIALANLFDEEGYCVEVISRQRLFACQQVAFSSGIYYYLQNAQAITKRFGVRKFYYVEIDVKMLAFLQEKGFELNVQSRYYLESIRRLIGAQKLYYQRANDLSLAGRKTVKRYLSHAYQYETNRIELFDRIKPELTTKQSVILGTHSKCLFNIYCFLRK